MKAAFITDNAINALVSTGVTSLFEIQDCLAQFPRKVVLAKLRQMVNKGRLEGCACGCRGDFKVKDMI